MLQKRDLGLDVIRLLSLFAITIHHFIWVVWYTLDVPVSNYHAGWSAIENYARSISFSGHTIIFMSTFLIARAETRALKTWAVVLFATVGWFIFCLFEYGDNEIFWVWDIYPLIAFGLATIALARQVSGKWYAHVSASIGLLGLLLTFIPFWNWPSLQFSSLFLRQAIVGDCRVDLADWPILPWIGIIWMGYGLGTVAYKIKQSSAGIPLLAKWNKAEVVLWPILLIGAIPNLGAFYHIQLGPMFACFSFRQAPIVFWSHFIYVIFFLRLSLASNFNEWIGKFRLAQLIGELKISRNFGVSYIVHYALIEAARLFHFPPNAQGAWGSFFAVLLILPLTEALMRLLSVAVKTVSKPTGLEN